MKHFAVMLFQLPVRLYRYFLSPFFGNQCRFHPTCSAYMLEALEQHGVLKGLALGIWRILRCNPWFGCHGCDPVPERFAWGDIIGYKRRRNHNHEPVTSTDPKE